ncbi:kinesin-like protein KIF12 [Artemia franciscana]|uniref:kinesin-like protein KIF12 n=1 Tax=Artemia franciscana TaxID=6661 RepID=UPI0032DB8798
MKGHLSSKKSNIGKVSSDEIPSPSDSSRYGSTVSLTGSINSLTDDDGENDGNVRVIVRIKPLNAKQVRTEESESVQVISPTQILVKGTKENITKNFTFSSILTPEVSQADVFEQSGVKDLIDKAVQGFSSTIFCYGQTGSGKTHTLTGPPHLFGDRPDPYSEDHGLVYRSFVYLYDSLQGHEDVTFTLKASFYEIYNEKIIDLLNFGTNQQKFLNVRWSRKFRGFYVENLFTVQCDEFDDLLAVLEEGMRYRAVGFHNMNEHSSRSHTILTVHVIAESKDSQEGVFISRHGKINFVDLAGSEMTKKTKSHGKTLVEANNINKSLMVLGYCISKLSEGKKRNSGHIPYRDSQLTKLLADSLAGNGVSLMIACISPTKYNFSETVNTLRYAARAKRIKNSPVIVMDPRESLILSLRRALTALQIENEHLRALTNVKKSKEFPNFPEMVQPVDGTVDRTAMKYFLGETDKTFVHRLLQENIALRDENAELYAIRDSLMRDQEEASRQNERLKKMVDFSKINQMRQWMNELSRRGYIIQVPSMFQTIINVILR